MVVGVQAGLQPTEPPRTPLVRASPNCTRNANGFFEFARSQASTEDGDQPHPMASQLETMSEQSQLPIDVYTELGKRYRKELPSLWPKKTTSKDSAHASQGKNEDAGRKKRKSAKEGGRAKKRTMVIEDSEEEGPTSSPLPVVAIAAVGAASVGGG